MSQFKIKPIALLLLSSMALQGCLGAAGAAVGVEHSVGTVKALNKSANLNQRIDGYYAMNCSDLRKVYVSATKKANNPLGSLNPNHLNNVHDRDTSKQILRQKGCRVPSV